MVLISFLVVVLVSRALSKRPRATAHPRRSALLSALLLGAYHSAASLCLLVTTGIDVGWAHLVGIGFFPLDVLIATAIGLGVGAVVVGGTVLVDRAIPRGAAAPARRSVAATIAFAAAALLISAGFVVATSAWWATKHFGGIGIGEMVYTISQPLVGTDSGQIRSFLLGPVLQSVVGTATVMLLLWAGLRIVEVRAAARERRPRRGLRTAAIAGVGVLTLGSGVAAGVDALGVGALREYFFEQSTLYDQYYVDPAAAELTFPEHKRNLIYIYLESMESTYTSEELGGAQTADLIPNLTSIARSGGGVNFSNTDLVGGAQQVPGVGFTIGALVAQTSGLPLRVTGDYDVNTYGGTGTTFMPGAYSLGQVLEAQGYRQALLIGSDAAFGGRDRYFSEHGDYDLIDLYKARASGWIPEDYQVWWGYEDAKLFDFAKTTITDLASSDEPFNFTMLTADTHFPSGYMTDQTPVLFDDQYANVIHYSDQMVGELLTWISEQPFADDTTVVISGDHLSMDVDFFENLDEDYERTVFNLFINSAVEPYSTQNRTFSTMDMYPSTLAALGVKIEGDRLGLGTNLFSELRTVPETVGLADFRAELNRRSEYYDATIMQGSDVRFGTASATE